MCLSERKADRTLKRRTASSTQSIVSRQLTAVIIAGFDDDKTAIGLGEHGHDNADVHRKPALRRAEQPWDLKCDGSFTPPVLSFPFTTAVTARPPTTWAYSHSASRPTALPSWSAEPISSTPRVGDHRAVSIRRLPADGSELVVAHGDVPVPVSCAQQEQRVSPTLATTSRESR